MKTFAVLIILQLLQFNSRERLGGVEIKEHPFFQGVSWDDLLDNEFNLREG